MVRLDLLERRRQRGRKPVDLLLCDWIELLVRDVNRDESDVGSLRRKSSDTSLGIPFDLLQFVNAEQLGLRE